jgi:hypothetical protein
MGKILELSTNYGTALVESTTRDDDKKLVQAGDLSTEKNLDKMREIVKPISESLINCFERLTIRPTFGSPEFGLNVTGEATLFIVSFWGGYN